jgi:hypothetical protein
MAELRIPIIGEFKGKKAFDQAGKATGTLDKGVKKLAGALAAAFSVQKIVQFGKAAAKAFIEDEKAASRLAMSVKNLGLAFETPRIEEFISQMAKASGVTDDQLRPAMQRLLQTTGSVTKSQELLTQALDISRGSGVDYETVVNDLSMAYVGQTRGLRKYSLGLTQAELKSMSFAEVQERMTKNFSGANATYLETYAGQMGILSNAAGEASEIIGQGLIDSLMVLSGDTTVADLAATMEELATNTATALTNLAKFGQGVKDVIGPIATGFEKFINATQPFFNSIVFGDALTFAKPSNVGRAGRSFGGGSGGAGGNIADNIARRKAEADAAKRAKQLADAAKRAKELAALQKKSLALQKASKTLNLEAISIEAALKGQISETDRLSLLLQKAILEGNESLATRLSDQLQTAIDRQNELRNLLANIPEAPNPFRNWTLPADLLNYTASSLGVSVAQLQAAPVMPSSNFSDAEAELAAAYNSAASATQQLISLQVILDGNEVGNAIQDASINNSLSGSFNTVNRTGRFGTFNI